MVTRSVIRCSNGGMITRKQLGKAFYKAGYWTVYHDGIEHAGYLAFLGLLALFPFLVFFVALGGMLGQSEVGEEFVKIVMSNVPQDFIAALQPRINEIVSGPPQGLFTLAILATIWTSSSAVEGTRTILNRAYRVKTPPAYIWRRLMSMGQFIVLTVAVFVGMFMLIIAPVVWGAVQEKLKLPTDFIAPIWGYFRVGLSVTILGVAIAGTYYILPNIKQRLWAVVPGTIMVLIGWVLAGMLFAQYLHTFNQLNLVYGGLGGIIVALIFFYILSVVYIFGAEFNYQIEQALGHKTVQKEAVPDTPPVDDT